MDWIIIVVMMADARPGLPPSCSHLAPITSKTEDPLRPIPEAGAVLGVWLDASNFM